MSRLRAFSCLWVLVSLLGPASHMTPMIVISFMVQAVVDETPIANMCSPHLTVFSALIISPQEQFLIKNLL